jgi:prepilin-type processing-associated H-X9-DG protein
LVKVAAGKNGTVGHSYEVAGWLNARTTGNAVGANIRKTQRVVTGYTYRLYNTTFPQLNFYGQQGGPSDVWIFVDADDNSASDPSRKNNNYPDPGDNHGADGGNVAFADGHAEWVSQKNYLRSFFRGTDYYHDAIIP